MLYDESMSTEEERDNQSGADLSNAVYQQVCLCVYVFVQWSVPPVIVQYIVLFSR